MLPFSQHSLMGPEGQTLSLFFKKEGDKVCWVREPPPL